MTRQNASKEEWTREQVNCLLFVSIYIRGKFEVSVRRPVTARDGCQGIPQGQENGPFRYDTSKSAPALNEYAWTTSSDIVCGMCLYFCNSSLNCFTALYRATRWNRLHQVCSLPNPICYLTFTVDQWRTSSMASSNNSVSPCFQCIPLPRSPKPRTSCHLH